MGSLCHWHARQKRKGGEIKIDGTDGLKSEGVLILFGSFFHFRAAIHISVGSLFSGSVGLLPTVPIHPSTHPLPPHLDAFELVPDTWSGFEFEEQGWPVNIPSHRARFLHVYISLLPGPMGLES